MPQKCRSCFETLNSAFAIVSFYLKLIYDTHALFAEEAEKVRIYRGLGCARMRILSLTFLYRYD
jgi:hypothetical protein